MLMFCLAFLILPLFLFFVFFLTSRPLCKIFFFSLCQENSSDTTSEKTLLDKCSCPSVISSFGHFIFLVSIRVEWCLCSLVYCCLHQGRARLLMLGLCTVPGIQQALSQTIFNRMNELRIRCTITSLCSFVSSMLLLMSFSLHGTIFLFL